VRAPLNFAISLHPNRNFVPQPFFTHFSNKENISPAPQINKKGNAKRGVTYDLMHSQTQNKGEHGGTYPTGNPKGKTARLLS